MNGVPEVALGVQAKNGGYGKWLLFFAVVFIVCTGMLAYALQTGSAEVPWAFLTANFIFLLGVSGMTLATLTNDPATAGAGGWRPGR